jgi:hypothetical protein
MLGACYGTFLIIPFDVKLIGSTGQTRVSSGQVGCVSVGGIEGLERREGDRKWHCDRGATLTELRAVQSVNAIIDRYKTSRGWAEREGEGDGGSSKAG